MQSSTVPVWGRHVFPRDSRLDGPPDRPEAGEKPPPRPGARKAAEAPFGILAGRRHQPPLDQSPEKYLALFYVLPQERPSLADARLKVLPDRDRIRHLSQYIVRQLLNRTLELNKC